MAALFCAVASVGFSALRGMTPRASRSVPIAVRSMPMMSALPPDAPSMLLAAAPVLSSALPPDAASMLLAAGPSANAVPSALAAYGHYLALVLTGACLTAERLTIKPAMSMEEERRMAIADAIYGLAGLLVVVTGYLRVTAYGKGWEFYAHEPIFWVKLLLVAVAGASSFFPTIKIIQRSVL